jgi:hypothetical protein
MTNSSVDNVNELLRLEYGDKGRLEDIKRRLGNGQTLYNSDNNYLEQLLNRYEGEIHKKKWFDIPQINSKTSIIKKIK